jgi:hypothetical protein
MKPYVFVFGLCVMLGTFALFGCGSHRKHERVVVSGTVIYRGKPLADGQIRLIPEKNSAVPSSGAPIVDGKYRVHSQGGAPVGNYKVSIEAYRPLSSGPQPSQPAPGAGGKNVEQYIPIKYNSKSELQLEVPSGSAEIVRNFELTN